MNIGLSDMTENPAYDKFPVVRLPPGHRIWRGTEAWTRIAADIEAGARLIGIDAYPGTDLPELIQVLAEQFPGAEIVDIEEAAARPIAEIDEMIKNNLTDDRVFGVLNHQPLDAFYDHARLKHVAERLSTSAGIVFAIGWGAALIPVAFDRLVLADMARWEIQQRQRAGAPNWRCPKNGDDDPVRKVKRGFFVEWRVADRHKRAIFDRIDYVLDTNASARDAKMITGEALRSGLRLATEQPFRVVPFFDPGSGVASGCAGSLASAMSRTTPGASTACPRRTVFY